MIQPKTVADLTESVMPSIVRINVKLSGERRLGSGFVLDPSGIIVTNYHVIEGGTAAEIVFADKTKAAISGYYSIHPGKDLAF